MSAAQVNVNSKSYPCLDAEAAGVVDDALADPGHAVGRAGRAVGQRHERGRAGGGAPHAVQPAEAARAQLLAADHRGLGDVQLLGYLERFLPISVNTNVD